jgi:TolB-like protein/Tfp pilus assembly protein PilF
MALTPLDQCSQCDQDLVREQLDRIAASAPFHQSQRRQRFLKYLVDETLAGRGERLKAYTIAVEVFERPQSFDPLVDPIVRIEAGRLRDKLREYYEGEGKDDPIRIELPKGSYVPQIELGDAAKAEPASPRPGLTNESPHAEPAPPASIVEQKSDVAVARVQAINWRQLGALAAAALVIIAAGFWLTKDRSTNLQFTDKPSIAVLPFDNIGDDAKWERLAEGITEDIITDLSHSKALFVIARSSTEVYKGKAVDIRQIGRDLSVKYVLEGSIQSMGERIRVTAQLIEAASGSHVWSERYDRPAEDLFEVQNDVTGKIAASLATYKGAVAEAERSLIRRKPPANLTAFDTYLLALSMKHNVTKESLTRAEELLHKALELDPQLARAYVGLSDVYFYLIDLGLAPSVEEAIEKMTKAAEMAVRLDPEDGKSHQALGAAHAYHGKHEQALLEYDRAEALAPSDADLLLINAWALPQFGQSGRAVDLAERALKLNPRYPDWYNQGLRVAYFFGEQHDKAVKYQLLVKEPLGLDYAYLAMSYAYLDRTGDAETAASNVRKVDPNWNAERYLSEAGGYLDKEAELFVNGARRAGLNACVAPAQLKEMLSLIRVKSCDAERARANG